MRFLDLSAKPQKAGRRQAEAGAPVRSGIDAETAKKILTALKASKLKVQGAIQGDAVRVTGAKRDDCRRRCAVAPGDHDAAAAFDNFRD